MAKKTAMQLAINRKEGEIKQYESRILKLYSSPKKDVIVRDKRKVEKDRDFLVKLRDNEEREQRIFDIAFGISWGMEGKTEELAEHFFDVATELYNEKCGINETAGHEKRDES